MAAKSKKAEVWELVPSPEERERAKRLVESRVRAAVEDLIVNVHNTVIHRAVCVYGKEATDLSMSRSSMDELAEAWTKVVLAASDLRVE